MIFSLFMAYIIVACFVSLTNWRWGVPLLVLAGVLEDPVRKVTPGTPALLTLTSVPIYICTLGGMFAHEASLVQRFHNANSRLFAAMMIFLVSLVPGAIVAVTYGAGSWQFALLGLFSYVSGVLSVMLGYAYPLNVPLLRRFLGFYCILTAVMLIGSPLEYLGITDPWNLIGTRALNTEWIRHQTGYTVRLVSGFYRSPDVMAWHAATLSMIAIILGISERRVMMWVWFAMASWGGVCVMISGRRKAFWMIPVFFLAMAMFFLFRRGARTQNTIFALLASAAVLGLGFLNYEKLGRNRNMERYYFGNLTRVVDDTKSHSWNESFITYRQSGFWGRGIGVATPGNAHIKGARPTAWQEEGMSRVMVELGVLGFICVIWLALAYMATTLRIVLTFSRTTAEWPILAGLLAMAIAHGSAFQVSHLVYGTPFIGILLPMMLGFILAGKRLLAAGAAARPHTRQAPPPPKPIHSRPRMPPLRPLQTRIR